MARPAWSISVCLISFSFTFEIDWQKFFFWLHFPYRHSGRFPERTSLFFYGSLYENHFCAFGKNEKVSRISHRIVLAPNSSHSVRAFFCGIPTGSESLKMCEARKECPMNKENLKNMIIVWPRKRVCQRTIVFAKNAMLLVLGPDQLSEFVVKWKACDNHRVISRIMNGVCESHFLTFLRTQERPTNRLAVFVEQIWTDARCWELTQRNSALRYSAAEGDFQSNFFLFFFVSQLKITIFKIIREDFSTSFHKNRLIKQTRKRNQKKEVEKLLERNRTVKFFRKTFPPKR